MRTLPLLVLALALGCGASFATSGEQQPSSLAPDTADEDSSSSGSESSGSESSDSSSSESSDESETAGTAGDSSESGEPTEPWPPTCVETTPVSESTCAAIEFSAIGYECPMQGDWRIANAAARLAYRDFDGNLIEVADAVPFECTPAGFQAFTVIDAPLDEAIGPKPIYEYRWTWDDLVTWRCTFDRTREALDLAIAIGEVAYVAAEFLASPVLCTEGGHDNCYLEDGTHASLGGGTCCLESGEPTDEFVRIPCD